MTALYYEPGEKASGNLVMIGTARLKSILLEPVPGIVEIGKEDEQARGR